MSAIPWLEAKVKSQEARIEAEIRELSKEISDCEGVQFTGDPRGYCVRLMLRTGRYNTWGGKEGGYGIA